MNVTAANVARALHEVTDPELGIDVVELGLIYGIAVDDLNIRVAMTTTTEYCPMGEMLLAATLACLGAHWPERLTEVAYVSEPEWAPGMLSDRAQEVLGTRAGA